MDWPCFTLPPSSPAHTSIVLECFSTTLLAALLSNMEKPFSCRSHKNSQKSMAEFFWRSGEFFSIWKVNFCAGIFASFFSILINSTHPPVCAHSIIRSATIQPFPYRKMSWKTLPTYLLCTRIFLCFQNEGETWICWRLYAVCEHVCAMMAEHRIEMMECRRFCIQLHEAAQTYSCLVFFIWFFRFSLSRAADTRWKNYRKTVNFWFVQRLRNLYHVHISILQIVKICRKKAAKKNRTRFHSSRARIDSPFHRVDGCWLSYVDDEKIFNRKKSS